MDNLLGTGGATASRLTLPQKIIATGMSVILAFGLSPIGQAPAYAKGKEANSEPSAQVEKADKGEAPELQAQGEEGVLEVQAPTDAVEVEWDYELNDLVYSGKATGNPFSKLNVKVSKTDTTSGTGVYSRTLSLAADAATMDGLSADFTDCHIYLAKETDKTKADLDKPVTTTFTPATGKQRAMAADGYPFHAGDYVLVAKGLKTGDEKFGTIADAEITVPFTIGSYVAADHEATLQITPQAPSIEYTGAAANFLYLAENGELTVTGGTDYKKHSFESDKFEIDRSYQTKAEPAKYDVPVAVTGDVVGSATMPVEITQTVLRNPAIKVNGNALKVLDPGAEDGTTSMTAEAAGLVPQAAGATASPVESLVIGEKTLELGKDYEVVYIDESATTPTESKTVPTEVGQYTVRLKTIAGSKYLNEYGVVDINAYKDLKLKNTTYDITGWKITDSSKSFKELGAASATVEGGTYAGVDKAVEASSIKIADSLGHDLTSLVDGHYTVTYVPWTAQMERDYLGTEVFAMTYPDDKHEYDNTNAALNKDSKPAKAGDYGVIIKSTSKDVDWTKPAEAEANTIGYVVDTVKGDSDGNRTGWGEAEADPYVPTYDKAKLVKMTVNPVTVVEGTGAGQVTIAPVATGTWTDEYSVSRVINVDTKGVATVPSLKLYKVEYVKDPSAVEEKDRAEEVKSYTITVESADGANLKAGVMQAGKYTAVINFTGNFTGKVAASSTYTVAPFDPSKYLKTLPLMGKTMFTGYDITAADVARDNSGFVVDATKAFAAGNLVDPDTALTEAQMFTIAAIGAKDVTWTGVPYAPKAVYSDYDLTVTGQGNYTGSLPSEDFAVGTRDLKTETMLQFRNPGEATWTNADDGTFAVALDTTTGAAVPPESRLVAWSDGAPVQVTAADGTKSDLVIPAAAYTEYLTYSNNKTAGQDASVVIDDPSDGTFTDSFTGSFKVVAATDTAAGKGYSIELTKGEKATYNGKLQDPGVKVFQMAGTSKVEADSTTYSKTVTVKSTGNVYDLKTGVRLHGAATTQTPDLEKTDMENDGVFVHADTYTIAATVNDLAGSLVATYTIDPLAVTQADVQSEYSATGLCIVIPDFNYGAGPAVPQVTLNGADVAKITTLDDTVYQNGYYVPAKELNVTKVGAYTANFQFKGDITGKVTQTFNVKGSDISKAVGTDGTYLLYFDGKAVPGKVGELTYEYNFDGLAKKPVITLVQAGKQVADESQMRVDIVGDNVNVGKFTVNVLFTGGNYEGTAAVECKINPANIGEANKDITCTFTEKETAYTGKPVQPKGTLTLKNAGDGYVLVEGKDYQVKYEGEAINVGDKGKVVYEALSTGNFWTGDGTRTEEFTVTAPVQVDLSEAVVTVDKTSFVYNGKEQAPKVTKVTVGNEVIDPANYVVTGSGTDAGKYDLTVAAPLGSQVTKGSTTVAFEIAKAKNTKFKVTAKTDTLKGKPAHKKVYKKKALYNISGAQGKVTFKKANKAGGNKIVVKKKGGIVLKKGLKVGTYKVKVQGTDAGNANYEKATSKAVAFKVVIAKKKK